MFDEWIEQLKSIIKSRATILAILFFILGGILIYRCFDLQIVQGQEYLDNFVLMTEKTREIASTRGRIFDRNGKVLAYNELAYSVRLEDVYDSGMSSSAKNRQMNSNIYKLIKMIGKNGDSIISDFNIVLDEDGDFEYSVSGRSLQRFLADVYGERYIEDLSDQQLTTTAQELVEYLGNEFQIGEYEVEGDTKSDFLVGKGYTREELLQMVTLRYALKLIGFRKYLGITVAKDISPQTVALLMENSDVLTGVTIEEDTVRRYVDSKYFAHILGYTGKISSEALESLNAAEAAAGGDPQRYNINDVVGKGGIEESMESALQGIKGSETVVVDSMGKTLEVRNHIDPIAGEDIYLTIDSDLQIAVYEILEQHIAGILLDKIRNIKKYDASASSSKDIPIPIYDVYFSMINNSILDIEHFASPDAGETEKAVYSKYLDYKEKVYTRLREELIEKKTPYNKLNEEYQVYQSNIVSLLNKNDVIDQDMLDRNDDTYIAWANKEIISLNEYLNFCIDSRWIDVNKLSFEEKYVDSEETYEQLVEYIISLIDGNLEFQKKLYKYMLLSDIISGKDICMLLCEQNAVKIDDEDEEALYSGKLSAYQFMINRIKNLDITPAQMALDPCNGSVVITDVNSGQVLAMVSYPGYDNNMMANSVNAQYYAKLTTDKSSPLLNYATQYEAAPGSTFKMVSATAGLCEGVITLRDKINCVKTYTNITPSPNCWSRGHGPLDVIGGIQNSCNYFFYEVGYRLSTRGDSYNDQEGLDALAYYADLYGLSERSGVEISEYAPIISNGDAVRSAIGQGSNSYTTSQLARYVATVANSGTCYDLTLLDKITDSSGNVVEDFAPKIRNTIEMDQQYWDAIHTGMRRVVEGKKYFNDLAVQVAGKTGTAEQIKTRANHALFVGYAPYNAPELAFAARIPFGYSSDYAAQLTRDIVKYYYGLAKEEELITGTANEANEGASVNEY